MHWSSLLLTRLLPTTILLAQTAIADPFLAVHVPVAATGLTPRPLQINIRIPEDLASTPDLPLILEVGGVRSPPGVTL